MEVRGQLQLGRVDASKANAAARVGSRHNRGKPSNRLARACNHNLFACLGLFQQGRELALGLIYVYKHAIVPVLSWSNFISVDQLCQSIFWHQLRSRYGARRAPARASARPEAGRETRVLRSLYLYPTKITPWPPTLAAVRPEFLLTSR